jgi:hypothetical protein
MWQHTASGYNPEDGGSMFVRRMDNHLPNYMVSTTRRQQYEAPPDVKLESGFCVGVTILLRTVLNKLQLGHDQVKDDDMGMACSMHGVGKMHTGFRWETQKESGH